MPPRSLADDDSPDEASPLRTPPSEHDAMESDGGEGEEDGEKDETTRTHNAALERRTLRKLDFLLLPFLAALFLLNSLDKSNIGNAETGGFTRDVGLARGDVNLSMAAFFFVFVLLQPAGAALGRVFGMARYVPVCMALWGLSTTLHIFVRSRAQLIALRVAIAVLESGFYPTTVSYLSLFYTRFEFAWRLGFFYGMTAVSGALGGVLAWAVFSQFHGDDPDPNGPQIPPSTIERALSGDWKSWQILFLIEGCTTMTIALIGFLWLPKSAGTAWFFSADERVWAERRMARDQIVPMDESKAHNARHGGLLRTSNSVGQDTYDAEASAAAHDRLLGPSEMDSSMSTKASLTSDAGLSRHDVVSAFFNVKIWHLLIVNILSATPATAFNVLLPILVKELSPSLSLSPAASNLLSAPPFAMGAVVLFLFTAWSDKIRQRLLPILCGLGLLLLGLMLTIWVPDDGYWLRYFALCVLLSGSFIASPLTVAWLANNTPEAGKRAILLGINGWGNLAGVFMAVLFTPDERDTGYERSFIVLLVCVGAAFAGFIAFWVLIFRENKWREDVTRGWSMQDGLREDSVGDVPVPLSWQQRWSDALGVHKLAKKLGLEEGRRGDDKLTYRYGL